MVLPALAIPACGGSDDDKRGLLNAAGKASAGTGGTMSPHIGTGGAAGRGGSGGSATGTGGNGTGATGVGGSTGGTGAGGTTGGTGSGARGGTSSAATGGASDDAGTSGQKGGAPDPTDDGMSPYTVPCNESTPCEDPTQVTCLGIRLDEGGARFTCSNDCDSKADCSDAPTGVEAEADCVQFTMAKHCVLVCYDNGAEAGCPDGMGCYVYPNSPIGYCLWL